MSTLPQSGDEWLADALKIVRSDGPEPGQKQPMAEQVVSIEVGAIRPNNVRKTFDQADLEEMAETIREHGIVSPLIVRPAVDGVYELVAGERRWRAAQIAGLDAVPATVRAYTDREMREVQLIENVQRKGLNAVEEGAGYRSLIHDHGFTPAQIAARIGKGKRYVYQRLEIEASLIPAAREALAAHEITPNHVMLLARLRSPEQQGRALEFQQRHGAPVKQLDRWIKRSLLLKLEVAPFDRGDAGLVAGAGTCGECPKNSGNARELYADVKVDCCTDPGCYKAKVDAHVTREIKASGGDLVQIVLGYHHFWPEKKPSHVRDTHEYSLITKPGDKCAHQAEAIVVFGEQVGARVQICFSAVCKKHKRTAGGSVRRPAAELAKARAEKLELEAARAVRGRIVDAIVERAPMGMTLRLMATIAEEWWGHLSQDERRAIQKRHTWVGEIPFGTLDVTGLVRLLVELSLVRELWVSNYGNKSVPKSLQGRAESAGVDWAAIERAGLGTGAKKKAAKKR